MTALPAFEIRVTTWATRSILRALTEREAALKAEALLRKVHARGELIGLSIVGSDSAAAERIKYYLADVLTEVARIGF